MNSTELKQQAILAHRETCFFRNKKGGCETAVKKQEFVMTDASICALFSPK